jgi:hypothetical protein
VPYANDPGALRRLWWRSAQGHRLTAACLGVLLSLAGTSLTLFGGESLPEPRTADQFTVSVTPRPGDPEITVESVSEVDLFDGLDTATGDLVAVRVAGVRSAAPCAADGSLAFARKTLEGKKVRLVLGGNAMPAPDGRLAAKVLLPDGQDLALQLLTAGAALALAQADSDGQRLVSAETDARQNHRGLWAGSCAPPQTHTSTDGGPSSTITTTSATRESGSSTVRTPDPTWVPAKPTTTTATATAISPPLDDIQRGVKVGDACSSQGALGITDEGQNAECRRKGSQEGFRWTKV